MAPVARTDGFIESALDHSVKVCIVTVFLFFD